jgi:phenylacetate-CoA ligase
LNREDWESFYQEQLAALLVHSRNNVKYYSDWWDENFPNAENEYIADLGNWPILEKETVRVQGRDLISNLVDPRKLKNWNTSGSTGTPTRIWWGPALQKARWEAFEARHRRWYGVRHGDPFALIGGRMVTPISQSNPPFWVWNSVGKQLYMSSYHLSKQNIPFYLEEIKRRNIRHIYAYTSSVYEIANMVLEKELSIPRLKVVVTQAEPLSDHQRFVIERAFRCPVRESYGMAEMVVQASECEEGNMHLWPEFGVCEVDVGGGALMRNGTGDLVATGFLNFDMPLIRYRTGDIATLGGEDKKCSCGRGLPILEEVVGRVDDVLETPDGRKVGRLSTVFKNLPIVEAQTIQRSLNHFVIKVVPDHSFDSSSEIALVRSFKERLGDVNVELVLVDAIPRGENGKFRAVVQEMM